jgi:DNA polymerase V
MFALIDCNNFYASCERVFNPMLEGKPVVILSNNDGCIISRSNEAKALGIKMGDPAFKMEDILRKNEVFVFSSNYALYGDLSERVMNTLIEMIPDIEIYSIDEAFLDLSGIKYQNLLELGTSIRNSVILNTGIPVSVGIAKTKTLAKAANHISKKQKQYNGVCLLESREDIDNALKDLPVEEIWGIGRQYTKLLRKQGITTAKQLCEYNDAWIRKNLTVMGLRMVSELRGEPCISIEAEAPPKKAICTARSFGNMTSDILVLEEAISNHAARCSEKLRYQGSSANMLCVFVETNRFKENEPQYHNYKVVKLPVATNITSEIIKYTLIGLRAIYKPDYRYKKVGVIVSGMVDENGYQLNVFDTLDREKNKNLMKYVDNLNMYYGRDVVKSAAQGYDRKWKLRQEKLSPCYTTRWSDLLTIKV